MAHTYRGTYFNTLPKDLMNELDKYLAYSKEQEKIFISLLYFYISRTGGDDLTNQEFEEEWYNDYQNLTRFFTRHKLHYNLFLDKDRIIVEYDGKDPIDEKLIRDLITLIVNRLGLEKDEVEDLNSALRRFGSNLRVIATGSPKHRFFEIAKV